MDTDECTLKNPNTNKHAEDEKPTFAAESNSVLNDCEILYDLNDENEKVDDCDLKICVDKINNIQIDEDLCDEKLTDRSVKRLTEALKTNNHSRGVHNFLIPEVKQYYNIARKAVNLKYGVKSQTVLLKINTLENCEELCFTEDEDDCE